MQARGGRDTRDGRRPTNGAWTIPLTPVQERYLVVMELEEDENERSSP